MAKQKKPEEKPAGSPAWMATFADLVTLLMCFFVILFAMAETSPEQAQRVAAAFRGESVTLLDTGAGEGILTSLGSGLLEIPDVQTSRDEVVEDFENAQEEISQMASNFKTYFAESGLADNQQIEIIETEDSVKIRFVDGIMFDSGRAVLKPEAVGILDILADELIQNSTHYITIAGHTDNIPISTIQHPTNMHLSFDRAFSVASYLTNERGISPTRIQAVGFGEYRPLVDNDTPENRARNRRVEIDIVNQFTTSR